MEELNKVLYTARATAVDGREGRVTSESGRLVFDLAKPESMGGTGENRTNPEELFACGYAACFGGAIEYVASQKGMDIGSIEVKAHVDFGLTGSGVGLGVTIESRIGGVDDETTAELMQAAHEQVCPYSKATRGNINVQLGLLKN